jgi:hypothetical protein
MNRTITFLWGGNKHKLNQINQSAKTEGGWEEGKREGKRKRENEWIQI